MTSSIYPFIAFAIFSTFTPGAATTLSTTSGAHYGFRKSIPLMVGASNGLSLLSFIAGVGMTSILTRTASLQLAIKALGSIYLLWLAWKIGRSGRPGTATDHGKPANYFTGAWVLIQNPKAWAMTLGAAASYSALSPDPLSFAILLSAVFGITSGISLVFWCLTGQLLGRLLKTDFQWQVANGALGLLLALSILSVWIN